MMTLRVVMVWAKIVFFLLALGSLGMGLLAEEAGPWVFGVFPVTVILATSTVAISRSMKLRAAMRLVDEEEEEAPSAEHPGA